MPREEQTARASAVPSASLSLSLYTSLLPRDEKLTVRSHARRACIPVFHPEYGRYMLESTPGAPYGATLSDLLLVEGNMRFRRQLAKSRMKPHEVPLTLTVFPRLGAEGVFTDPYFKPGGGVARSLFLPDEIINQHVRFPCVDFPSSRPRRPCLEGPAADLLSPLPLLLPSLSPFLRRHRTLTANIRRRRGSKVAINMPVFVDDKTPRPFVDPTVPRDRNDWPEDKSAFSSLVFVDVILVAVALLAARGSRPSGADADALLPSQTLVTAPPSTTTSTWTPWASAWAAAACRSRSRRARSARRAACTTRSCPSAPSCSP